MQTLAKAHNWYQGWHAGEVDSTRAIAEEEGACISHVGDLMRLAFLSPKILDAILAGRQSTDLITHHLVMTDRPLAWANQERLLGF